MILQLLVVVDPPQLDGNGLSPHFYVIYKAKNLWSLLRWLRQIVVVAV